MQGLWQVVLNQSMNSKGENGHSLKPLTAVTVNRQAGISLRRGADASLNLGGNADFIRPKYNKGLYLGLFYLPR